jgi:hypothetical protein
MNKIFSLIESGANGMRKLQAEVSDVIKSGEWAPIKDAAQAIAAKYPKDKKARNTRLSMLRVQMGRACDAAEIARLTVKLVDGQWTVAIIEPKEPDADAKVLKAFELVEASAREGGPILSKLLGLVRELAESKPITDEVPQVFAKAA